MIIQVCRNLFPTRKKKKDWSWKLARGLWCTQQSKSSFLVKRLTASLLFILEKKTSYRLTAQLVHTQLGVLDLFWSVGLAAPSSTTGYHKHAAFFLRRPSSSPPFSPSHIHTYSWADCNAAGTVLQPASVLLCPGLSQVVVYPTSRNKKR